MIPYRFRLTLECAHFILHRGEVRLNIGDEAACEICPTVTGFVGTAHERPVYVTRYIVKVEDIEQ
jgi:hypothetical protein